MVSSIWSSLLYIWLSRDFCHMSSMNLLMIGLRSDYMIFVWDMSVWRVFLQLCLPFSFDVYEYGLVFKWGWYCYYWIECSFCLGVLRADYVFLYWICLSRVLFAAFSAFWFPYIPKQLGVQVWMMLLLLDKVFILFRNFVMRRDNLFLLCCDGKADLESELINLEDLWLALILMARFGLVCFHAKSSLYIY